MLDTRQCVNKRSWHCVSDIARLNARRVCEPLSTLFGHVQLSHVCLPAMSNPGCTSFNLRSPKSSTSPPGSSSSGSSSSSDSSAEDDGSCEPVSGGPTATKEYRQGASTTASTAPAITAGETVDQGGRNDQHDGGGSSIAVATSPPLDWSSASNDWEGGASPPGPSRASQGVSSSSIAISTSSPPHSSSNTLGGKGSAPSAPSGGRPHAAGLAAPAAGSNKGRSGNAGGTGPNKRKNPRDTGGDEGPQSSADGAKKKKGGKRAAGRGGGAAGQPHAAGARAPVLVENPPRARQTGGRRPTTGAGGSAGQAPTAKKSATAEKPAAPKRPTATVGRGHGQSAVAHGVGGGALPRAAGGEGKGAVGGGATKEAGLLGMTNGDTSNGAHAPLSTSPADRRDCVVVM